MGKTIIALPKNLISLTRLVNPAGWCVQLELIEPYRHAGKLHYFYGCTVDEAIAAAIKEKR